MSINRDELEALIDSAQTVSDSANVSFLAEVAREQHRVIERIESALCHAGKRPPDVDTAEAVVYALGATP